MVSISESPEEEETVFLAATTRLSLFFFSFIPIPIMIETCQKHEGKRNKSKNSRFLNLILASHKLLSDLGNFVSGAGKRRRKKNSISRLALNFTFVDEVFLQKK